MVTVTEIEKGETMTQDKFEQAIMDIQYLRQLTGAQGRNQTISPESVKALETAADLLLDHVKFAVNELGESVQTEEQSRCTCGFPRVQHGQSLRCPGNPHEGFRAAQPALFWGDEETERTGRIY
jgi:hypothetical protein